MDMIKLIWLQTTSHSTSPVTWTVEINTSTNSQTWHCYVLSAEVVSPLPNDRDPRWCGRQSVRQYICLWTSYWFQDLWGLTQRVVPSQSSARRTWEPARVLQPAYQRLTYIQHLSDLAHDWLARLTYLYYNVSHGLDGVVSQVDETALHRLEIINGRRLLNNIQQFINWATTGHSRQGGRRGGEGERGREGEEGRGRSWRGSWNRDSADNDVTSLSQSSARGHSLWIQPVRTCQ